MNAREALHSSESTEWYTPRFVIDFVEFLTGPIDLDPATTPAANQQVQAPRVFTEVDDGLERDWGGPDCNVFCNPPYGRGTGKWVQKALDVEARVTLLPNATPGRGWFQDLVFSPLTCWIWIFNRRIPFLDPKTLNPQDSPTHDSCLVFIGQREPADWSEVYQFVDDHESERLDGYAIRQSDVVHRREYA